MIKIEEVRIPRGKEPIFIDYPKIYGNPRKRLTFLRALIQIINTRANFIQFEELGLNSEDIDLFKGYLKKNYSKHFDPRKNTINLFENYDGKIICGVDLLIEDLFVVISDGGKEDTETSKLPNTIDQPENIADDNKEPLSSCAIFDIFYDWVFSEQYDKINFDTEIKVYLNDFYTFNESQIKNYFNIKKITEKIYENFKTSKIKGTKVVQIRTKMVSCLEEFEKHFSDKDYWAELIIQTKKIFKNVIDVSSIVKNEKMKLFLTFPRNPDIQSINNVISKYRNKIVLFQKDAPIFSKLNNNQIVQGEIIIEKDTFYIVKPLRILDFNEAKNLLLLGVDACPTREFVYRFLDDNI